MAYDLIPYNSSDFMSSHLLGVWYSYTISRATLFIPWLYTYIRRLYWPTVYFDGGGGLSFLSGVDYRFRYQSAIRHPIALLTFAVLSAERMLPYHLSSRSSVAVNRWHNERWPMIWFHIVERMFYEDWLTLFMIWFHIVERMFYDVVWLFVFHIVERMFMMLY
jgi:hypothetical protein